MEDRIKLAQYKEVPSFTISFDNRVWNLYTSFTRRKCEGCTFFLSCLDDLLTRFIQESKGAGELFFTAGLISVGTVTGVGFFTLLSLQELEILVKLAQLFAQLSQVRFLLDVRHRRHRKN